MSQKKSHKGKMPPKKPTPQKPQPLLFWVIIILFIAILYNMFIQQRQNTKDEDYSRFLDLVETNQVTSARFDNQNIRFTTRDGQSHATYMPFADPNIINTLHEKGVQSIVSEKPSKFWLYVLSWLPFLLLIGFWFFMMRSMQGGNNKAFTFGKHKAKLHINSKARITFADVAGVDEAKEELQEIVEFLKSPSKFQKLGGRIPRGVLLLGRPGTGKTLLAKAVAGEAGVPFFSISGSDFVEMFVGVGASRVRDLFISAKKNAPCIAFIDEIDAVGRSRGAGLGGGHDEREQTLNQLLVEMDGFEPNDSVIIIAATNRPDVLDPALLRAGRFDRQVVVDLPDVNGRNEILKVHTAKLQLSDDVQLMILARSTPGFSGADIANLCNEAALIAAGKGKKHIEMQDFDEARDKVTLGKERRSKVIDEEDKKITAYHEVGHVLCSVFQHKTDPIHKVTIIPRGFTGGGTHSLATDKSTYSRTYVTQILVCLMGGRCAEQIVFDELTTGAGNDIHRATELAKKMVCQWGMSDKVGPMTIGNEERQVFLGKDWVQHESLSESTAQLVDHEIRTFIDDAHKKATEIIQSHRNILDKMSEILLEKETLLLDEIYEIILAELTDETQREFIQQKYTKACDMKIDTSPKKTPAADDGNRPASADDDNPFGDDGNRPASAEGDDSNHSTNDTASPANEE